MYTFGQLKTDTRQRIWPSGESDRLVTAHDKMFVDALMDLQTWVACLRQDHTDLVPQCATFYNCGLTVFDAPRGRILQVSVVDKIDPDTLEEDASAATDYCQEIVYRQVSYCYVRDYLERSRAYGCCLSVPLFFCLPFADCGHASYPVPTDEGLPAGLPILPLGYHYPQDSTDSDYGRSFHGVWAIDRGKLYLAPWIQSTETVMVKWDGLKRTWIDQDPIDEDPMLSSAVEEYVRWQHASKYDRDSEETVRASGAYNLARQALIHECREETRLRGCEPSQARGASVGFGTLFYNDEQKVTLTCPAGQTGTPVTVTVAAGTVGSNRSVAEANATAQAQAREQAEAQLVCEDVEVTYTNNVAGDFTARCESTDPNAPAPTGAPVRVTIPIGTVEGSSQAEANSNAQQLAEQQAYQQLAGACTFYNSEKSYTASCTSVPAIPAVTRTIAAGTYSASDQDTANRLASNAARTLALDALSATCPGDFPPGGGGGDSGDLYNNTIRLKQVVGSFIGRASPGVNELVTWTITISATMPAATVTGKTQLEANEYADSVLLEWANHVRDDYIAYLIGHQAYTHCVSSTHQCGFNVTYPTAPMPPE